MIRRFIRSIKAAYRERQQGYNDSDVVSLRRKLSTSFVPGGITELTDSEARALRAGAAF